MSGQSYKIYSSNGLLQPGEVQSLLCSRCNLLLRNPVQVIVCGHRYCRSCLERYMSHGEGPFMCPVDKERFESREVRTDKGCQRELQGLEVSCTTQPKPCEWKGPITDLEAHQAQCPNMEVGVNVDKGLTTTSPEQTHLATQHQFAESARVEKHQESECTEMEVQCSMNFPGVKCSFRGKPADMSKHMQTHMGSIVCLLISAFSKIDTLEKRVDFLTNHQGGEDETESLGGECVTRLSAQGQKPEAYDDTQASMVVGNREPPHQLRQKWEEKKQPFQERLKALQQRVDSTQVQAMQDGHLQMVQQSLTRPGAALEKMDSHQTQLLKISENLQTVQQSMTQHAIVIDEVRLRQDVLDIKTTNGVFIWKIPDIRRRYRDALDGRTISLYSPPFYTSPHGYRMCVRTYLNGDGVGKGTHMSVFFVLMRSEYDSLLSYPFKQSVRFTLINQENPSASISEAFIPDLSSPSFHRPEKDMNVASGFPKFSRQSVLHNDNFTKGNTIFIKCQVDLSGLPLQ